MLSALHSLNVTSEIYSTGVKFFSNRIFESHAGGLNEEGLKGVALSAGGKSAHNSREITAVYVFAYRNAEF